MADTTDILLTMIDENWTQARHSEDQRATITNFIVVIASVIHGVLTQKRIEVIPSFPTRIENLLKRPHVCDPMANRLKYNRV
jgi:hypothetical protein